MLDRLERSTVGESFTRSTLEWSRWRRPRSSQPCPLAADSTGGRSASWLVAVVAAPGCWAMPAAGSSGPTRIANCSHDLPILEDLDLYEQAGSIDFLRKLADTGHCSATSPARSRCPGLAVPDSPAERRAEIDRMTPAEKEHLAHASWNGLPTIRPLEQQQLRALHDSLNHDATARTLREVLVRYHEWLDTLVSSVREELDDLPDDERIARIEQIKHEQAARRDRGSARRDRASKT